MPVMVLFRHGDCLTLAIINRRLHRRDESKDVLEKVTLIKDIRFTSPHRAHVEILFDLSFDALLTKYAFINFVALHAAWQKTLDTSVLNKQFYQELANWYFWALDHVTFPKDAPKDRDGRDSISLIRMVTRLIFCWFLKEKGLIPDDLFHEQKVHALLASLKEEENTYYTAILQNLFFATLNTEMDQPGKPPTRRFIDEAKDNEDSEDHMVHQVWRHVERIRDRATFEWLLRIIPFLNGGLFECLDERVEKGASSYTREVRVDGFSVKSSKQPKVPNFLFFGPERIVDLSNAYGELRYTQAKVWPLISLLERYKFTVSENTPIEEEVALDPELLGHVFENLLAAYNSETDKTARKTTGSFYTPRVVVDFMVDEALIVYLESALHSAINKPEFAFELRLRQLLRYTDEPHQFSLEEIRVLVDAIDQVKILDPACGSGAFPMGALYKLVFLLGKLDPGNEEWKERQFAKARQLDVGREAALQAVKDAFDRDHGDYGRKLYLIENCLYGVDI
jgi:adenine-specific DNA-methyltransferase